MNCYRLHEYLCFFQAIHQIYILRLGGWSVLDHRVAPAPVGLGWDWDWARPTAPGSGSDSGAQTDPTDRPTCEAMDWYMAWPASARADVRRSVEVPDGGPTWGR